MAGRKAGPQEKRGMAARKYAPAREGGSQTADRKRTADRWHEAARNIQRHALHKRQSNSAYRHMNSPLAKLIPNKPDIEKIKRDGWQEHGILVVSLNDDRLDMIDRELIQRLGKELYGERKSN